MHDVFDSLNSNFASILEVTFQWSLSIKQDYDKDIVAIPEL